MRSQKCITRLGALLQSMALSMIVVSQVVSAPAPQYSVAEASAQLRIFSKPADAEISINGKTRGTAPLTLNLKPGQYLLFAEKKGHSPIRQTINLTSEQLKTCELHLQPINGLLLIHSTPSDAEIEIDGASRGRTPAFINDLPLGKYRARFIKAGYLPKEIEISIDKRSPQKIDVSLTSDSATLTINSEPQGASVTINGISRGETPCTVDRIPSGNTTLEMDLDGFKHYNENLFLSAGESQLVSAPLKAIPSDLRIVSIPAGARIYVNNQFRGTAPVDLTNIASGTHRIRAEMAAHDIMLRNVEIGRAQNLVEEFRLQPNAGALEITTEPSGVTVLLSGKAIGTTVAKSNSTDRISESLSLKLIPSGEHTMILTKPGFFEKTLDITVVRNQTLTRHFSLKRRFIPNYEIKTATEVYRGILIEVDAQRNVKLETHPGIFKTIPRNEIRSFHSLREDQLENSIKDIK